ncbi:hypothetical protein RH915_05910 [Serpentinicella sp. ANB-PHB4]|uniref:hypothetical protein n=1 Tax=Serpentinicella sp. ANB-PHB4 TaxID=3074076 RepID=UPI002855922A|nr:hypothetical protein [Serpentinicella sp. ANB-PHB4]MDR5659018.1 hypothetical protein [Serpentinicella sp. ANB-PHB4]
MNKKEIKKVISELRINSELLNELEVKANDYRHRSIKHDLDGNILFELELLQEKLTCILYNFYLGDVEKDWREGKISSEEREEQIMSTIGKSKVESLPFFNFGYMNSDFLIKLQKLD